jgi:hypothetical protein
MRKDLFRYKIRNLNFKNLDPPFDSSPKLSSNSRYNKSRCHFRWNESGSQGSHRYFKRSLTVTKDSKCSNVIFAVKIDLNGMPAGLVNLVLEKHPLSILKIRKVLKT